MKLNNRKGFDFGTNILDIKVPDALRTKVATGVDYIDGSFGGAGLTPCLLYTSPSPRDKRQSRMPSSA